MNKTQRQFVSIVSKYFVGLLKRNGVFVRNLRMVDSSHVNYVFTCSFNGREAILKAGLFGRSMLFAYEKFLAAGPSVFSKTLDGGNMPCSNDIVIEVRSLRFLWDRAFRVPRILEFVGPNVVILEKIPGKCIDPGAFDKSFAEGLAKCIARLHQTEAPDNLKPRQISATSDSLIIEDLNFQQPMIARGLHSNIVELVSAHLTMRNLLHGDCKDGNIIRDGQSVCLLDPKLCVGIPHVDLGKFMLRLLLSANRNGLQKLTEGLVAFADQYSQIVGLRSVELQKTSVALGLIELEHLLSGPPRANIEILGPEMPMLYRQKNIIQQISHRILREGRALTVSQLASSLANRF
ncbi:MAG: phosphotransferase [Patescibacteria group bacterium]